MTQYGHAGRHHGVGTPECPRDLHHHHDERCNPPVAAELADRRQRAREAYWDVKGTAFGRDITTAALDDALETATRVRITPEILAAFGAARRVPSKTSRPIGGTHNARRIAGLIAAFRAAGFEVEE